MNTFAIIPSRWSATGVHNDAAASCDPEDFSVSQVSCLLEFDEPVAFPQNPMEPLRGMLGWALAMYMHPRSFSDLLPLARRVTDPSVLREAIEQRIPAHSAYRRLFKAAGNGRPLYNLSCPWAPGRVDKLPVVLRTFGPDAGADAALLAEALEAHGNSGFHHRGAWRPYRLHVVQPVHTLPLPEPGEASTALTVELMTPLLLDVRLDAPLPRIPLAGVFFPGLVRTNRKLQKEFAESEGASLDPRTWRFYKRPVQPASILAAELARSAANALDMLTGLPGPPGRTDSLRKAALEETVTLGVDIEASLCRVKQNNKGFGITGRMRITTSPLLEYWLGWAALVAVGECNIFGFGRVQLFPE